MMYLANELGNDASVYAVAYPTEEGGCLALYQIQTRTTYPADQAVKSGTFVGEVRVVVCLLPPTSPHKCISWESV
jgi:hypothetical protein